MFRIRSRRTSCISLPIAFFPQPLPRKFRNTCCHRACCFSRRMRSRLRNLSSCSRCRFAASSIVDSIAASRLLSVVGDPFIVILRPRPMCVRDFLQPLGDFLKIAVDRSLVRDLVFHRLRPHSPFVDVDCPADGFGGAASSACIEMGVFVVQRYV